MTRQQRMWTRRSVSWVTHGLIFGGLMILIGQRLNYYAAGVPGSGWVLLGTFSFAVGMVILAAQLQAALDKREHQRKSDEWAARKDHHD